MTNTYTIIFIIVGISVAYVVLNTVMYKKRIEEYTNYDPKFHEVNVEVNSFKPRIKKEYTDIRLSEPLTYVSCIEDTLNIEEKLGEWYFIDCIEFNSMSENDIYENIVNSLEDTTTKINDECIDGPVYSIVFSNPHKATDTILTKLYIIYPRYYLNEEPPHNIKKHDKDCLDYLNYLNDYIKSRKSKMCNLDYKNKGDGYGKVYTLNKYNPLFSKLIKDI